MAVPFPGEDSVDLRPPSWRESELNAAAVLTATRPTSGNTELQQLLAAATFEALTGHSIDVDRLPTIGAEEAAENLRFRNEAFRTRIVHMTVLSALVLRPIPPDVADRVAALSRALGIDDGLLHTVEQFATSDRALAAVDFERNGYTQSWSPERAAALHTSTELAEGWAAAEDDPALATRWRALAGLADGSLGRKVHEFYEARGFARPGTPGSAPPLLAQHDWVHVLADYGSRVESELEVFAFIARANDDPRGFSLLAMVVSLFETGYLADGAGLFESFPGQLSNDGMTTRIGDAMRRGALSHGRQGAPDVDFMAVDWFELAALPIDEVRELFGVPPKSQAAIDAGSVGPWEPGGISPAQVAMGQDLARREGRPYEGYGSSL
jgi:hypothetical protein